MKWNRRALDAVKSNDKPHGYEKMNPANAGWQVAKWIEQAYKDGAPIQIWAGQEGWVDVPVPEWCLVDTYRVNPYWVPKPPEKKYGIVRCSVDPDANGRSGYICGHGVWRPLSYAQDDKDFYGYEYASGLSSMLPRIPNDGGPANIPAYVQFWLPVDEEGSEV